MGINAGTDPTTQMALIGVAQDVWTTTSDLNRSFGYWRSRRNGFGTRETAVAPALRQEPIPCELGSRDEPILLGPSLLNPISATQIMDTDTLIAEETAKIWEQQGSSPDNRKKQLQTGF